MSEWDLAIAELAARAHGVVSRSQLFDVGLSPTAIDRRLAAGRLHRIHAGVYAVGHRELTLKGRWTAALLAAGPDGLLSHPTGAAAWEVLPAGTGLIHVSTRRRSRVTIAGAVLHRPRRIHPEDRAVRDGFPVTALPRTLLDLAETVPHHRLQRAFSEARRRHLLDFDELDRLLRRSTGRRGLPLLRALAAEHGPLPPWTRTELETRFFDLCVSSGLPTPAMNMWVGDSEVDAFWAGHRLIVELDGDAFHSDPIAVEEDRRRDARLTVAGYRCCGSRGVACGPSLRPSPISCGRSSPARRQRRAALPPAANLRRPCTTAPRARRARPSSQSTWTG